MKKITIMHMALFLIILGGLITLGCNGDDELS